VVEPVTVELMAEELMAELTAPVVMRTAAMQEVVRVVQTAMHAVSDVEVVVVVGVCPTLAMGKAPTSRKPPTSTSDAGVISM